MADRRPRPWSSLRVRITVISVVVIGIVLALVGFVTSRWVESTLVSTLDSELRDSAREIAALVEGSENGFGLGDDPRRRGRPDPAFEDLLAVGRTRSLQVIARDGHVIEASQGLSRRRALVTRPTRPITVDPDEQSKPNLRVHAVDLPDGNLLIVTESLRQVDEAASNLASVALPAGVAVTGILAAMIWLVTGRALGPVDALRREVDSISAADALARVSVPRSAELGRLATTMNGMLDRVQRSTEAQRRFVADASHELRSPLAGIRNQLEVNQQHPGVADYAATESEMLVEAERMTVLIDDLLTLARGDRDQLDQSREAVDVDDIIFEQTRSYRSVPNLAIDTEQVSGAQVFANPSDVRRVVRNLLDNAMRHATTKVTVVARERGSLVELVVADDGPGVPGEHAESIFERFTRLDDARARDAGGSGLGLAITRELLARNGATIKLETQAPEGARFLVRFDTNPPSVASPARPDR